MVAFTNSISRVAVMITAVPIVFGSVLPTIQDGKSPNFRRQALDSWEAYDQNTVTLAQVGICRFYHEDTNVDGLEPCYVYCETDSTSISCKGDSGKGAEKWNPDGEAYNMGECLCSSPELETIVEFTMEGLKDLGGVTCAAWLQALKESVYLSTWVIPSGAGAAAKVAKTVVKSIKRAEKLGGKDAWTNFIEETCDIEEWDFDISMAFDLGREADEE